MAQVETQSAFRHDSQHSNYYYPSASSNHSGSSSSSNSHHSSPRTSSILPQRYYSPTQYYTSEDQQHSPASYQHPTVMNHTYRSPYSKKSSHPAEPEVDESIYSPFPAYDHALPQTSPPILEYEEEEYDDDEVDDEPLESPSSLKSASPSNAFPHISDDIWTERGPGPSRQVDYLSHDWTEADIWSSWRYVRKEKAGYPQNAARLENASWRTWAKSKYKLKTITPETLNWLKDCDVTWLYGPLQSQGGTLGRSYTEPTSPAISEPEMHRHKMSRSSSFCAPSKPILKKRSHSEVMLTTLSGKTHGNLLTRAAQAVQDERRRELEEQELREEKQRNPLTPTHVLRSHQRMRRKGSTDLTILTRDSPESPFTVNQNVQPVRTDYFGQGNWTSSASSGGHTPGASKHIHFNDRVEQCIAVDVKDDEEENIAVEDDDDDSEDEGLFMMKSKHTTKPEHSTIAKLPATTLRPGDEPIREPPQIAFTPSSPSRTSPSPASQDDLNLPEPAGFYYEEGGGFSTSASPPEFPPPPTHFPLDQENLDEFSFDHPFASQSHSENMPYSNTSSVPTSATSSRRSSSLDLEEDSTRRASVSAIPIPSTTRNINIRGHGNIGGGDTILGDEEDEEGMGIVGLAADAISTAKDLVGVLWNAGWGGRR